MKLETVGMVERRTIFLRRDRQPFWGKTKEDAVAVDISNIAKTKKT